MVKSYYIFTSTYMLVTGKNSYYIQRMQNQSDVQ